MCFKVKEHNSSYLKELKSGIVTFLTMCYITNMNSQILEKGHYDKNISIISTIISTSISTFL